MNDIETRKDIEQLIRAFYAKVNADELLAPVFAHVDWETHMPVIFDFWSSIVFGDRTYQGNPFGKHIALPIGKHHFGQWLALFDRTVDDLFNGDRATEIKSRAHQIGEVFQHKMGLTKNL